MKEEIDYEVSEPKEEERVYVTPSANEDKNDKWQTEFIIGLIVVATIVAVISLISLVK